MDTQLISSQLKALADPNRRKIVALLSQKDYCACDILPHFEFTQPTLSHHMKILEQAHLITVEKRGSWHYYALNHNRAAQLTAELTHLFAKKNEKGE